MCYLTALIKADYLKYPILKFETCTTTHSRETHTMHHLYVFVFKGGGGGGGGGGEEEGVGE